MSRPTARRRRLALIHAGIIAAALLPLCALIVRFSRDALGANPIEEVTHETGLWALRFLLLALAVTPLRLVFGWRALAPYRRSFGLFSFFYACLHFSTWLGLDLFFDLGAMLEDVLERPYVTVGFSAFLCLLPLAITSTRGWVRRLGRRWILLHRLAYAAGILAIVHFVWLVKADLREPLIYAAILGVLFSVRLWDRARGRVASRTRSAAPKPSPAPEPALPESDEPVHLPIEAAIDLHSFAPRDVAAVVDAYLEAAVEAGLREVRLVHGKGKGVQRDRVQGLLARSPLVERYADAPPQRGGWGATLAWLRPAPDTTE